MKEDRKIFLGEREIKYTLERKDVQNVNLRIYNDGSIYISAKPKIPVAVIDDFIVSKRDLIEKSLSKFENKIIGDGLKSYETGEIFYLLGVPRTLEVEEGWEESVELREDVIKLTVRDADDVKHKQRKFEAWKKAKQEEIILPVCQRIYSLYKDCVPVYPEIVIRAMRSNWGLCTPGRNRIALNPKLIHVPEKCIEYVAIHEFAHFIEPNHSKRFYREVAERMPDYRHWQRDLEQFLCLQRT